MKNLEIKFMNAPPKIGDIPKIDITVFARVINEAMNEEERKNEVYIAKAKET